MSPKETTYPESGLWKDYLDEARIKAMAGKIGLACPSFKTSAFVSRATGEGYTSLELKDRIKRIAECLREFLPADYNKAVAVLKKVAPQSREFENWCLTTYIELYGLDHFDASLKALEYLTCHGTGEFAIRPFVISQPEKVLSVMHRWAEDPNEHVRRLAAEGSRPRGVWVAHVNAFKKDPRPVLELLEKLKADSSLYVRKAVANNLNDISKDNPDLAVKTARKWLRNGRAETVWIVKHGCRTLIKQGHPGALGLLGFTEKPKVEILKFKTSSKKVRIGDSFEISLDVVSKAASAQRLVVDYRLYYLKANGKAAPKVFKLAEKKLGPGEIVALSTRHSFRPMTTRQHYPGLHEVEVMVNGLSRGRIKFHLTD